ncbi:LIC_12616 family protein [Pseudomonas sp. NPDC098747]|uniref:phage neck terminator protein n=1 Tax=Pseudomonas sp. NPDC098747 TaxID=3364487 RepID=UPI00383AE63F
MSNTSATGGYLTPAGTAAPAEDVELEDILQGMVKGITALSGPMVRPRWQPGNPKQPEPTDNWCAIGVSNSKSDANPSITHDGGGDGAERYSRHEAFTVLASFYGPQSQGFAGLLRDGIFIPQNREALRVHRVAFVSASEVKPVPELVNQQWIRRYDLFLEMRRQIVRTYPVLNILSAEISIVD